MVNIFNVGRKDVILGYIAYFLKFFSSIMVLPFILSSLTNSEYAIWNIFLAINTFVILFDMGYGVVISRYAMYAYSGATEDNIETEKDLKLSGEPNYYFLYQIMIAAKRIYLRISKLVILVLIIMIIYILFISNDDLSKNSVIIPWLIFSLGVYINMLVLSEATIIKGLGKVRELQSITIINTLFDILLKIILLQIGFKLYGLSIAFLFSSILLTIQYFNITNKIRKKKYEDYKQAFKMFDNQFKKTFSSISNKSKGIGGVLLSNFIQNQLFLLIAPLYLSLEVIGSYGLSLQLVTVISAFASAPFNTYLMKMGNLMLIGENKRLSKIFTVSSFIFIGFFALGSIILIFLGTDILRLFNSNTDILSVIPLTILVCQGFVSQSIQKSTNIISLTNNQSYVLSLVISSTLIIILQLILFNTYPDITYLLLCNLVVQLSYNFWKWNSLSMNICGVSYKNIIYVPIQRVFSCFGRYLNKT